MVKVNRKGKNQNRVLLITSRHLLNLMPDNYSKCNRCMQVGSLHHVTKVQNGQEFVVHFTDEYDYRFRSPYCQQAVSSMATAYQNLTGNELSVVDVNDVDGLAAQVMTKVAVKKVGSSWGAAPLSGRLFGSSKAGGANAATAGVVPLPSSKDAADDDDSDDDVLGELSSRGGAAGAVDVSDGASGGATPASVGGAFASKSKYGIDDFTVMKVLGKGVRASHPCLSPTPDLRMALLMPLLISPPYAPPHAPPHRYYLALPLLLLMPRARSLSYVQAFGKVMLAKANDSGIIYAMKALSKATLIERNEIQHTKYAPLGLKPTRAQPSSRLCGSSPSHRRRSSPLIS